MQVLLKKVVLEKDVSFADVTDIASNEALLLEVFDDGLLLLVKGREIIVSIRRVSFLVTQIFSCQTIHKKQAIF